MIAIALIGVLPDMHCSGIGQTLLNHAKLIADQQEKGLLFSTAYGDGKEFFGKCDGFLHAKERHGEGRGMELDVFWRPAVLKSSAARQDWFLFRTAGLG